MRYCRLSGSDVIASLSSSVNSIAFAFRIFDEEEEEEEEGSKGKGDGVGVRGRECAGEGEGEGEGVKSPKLPGLKICSGTSCDVTMSEVCDEYGEDEGELVMGERNVVL